MSLFGPIFSVELLTTARRTRYYLLRVAYAGFLFALLWSAYEASFGRSSGYVDISSVAGFARWFFTLFAFVQVITIMLLAPAMTAGAIALERERRTIEYLFATDLSNREIVLGKLAARLVVILCQVFAGLPILSLAMLMGGIEPDKLIMVFIVSFSTALSLAALGVGASVWVPRARDAVGRVYLLLIALVCLPPVMFVVPNDVGRFLQPLATPLLEANPVAFLVRMFEPFGFTGTSYWTYTWKLVAYQGVLGLISIGTAVVAVRRVHLGASGAAAKAASAPLFRRRRPAVGDWPVLWKEMHSARTARRFGVVGTFAALAISVTIIGLAAWQIWSAIYDNHGWRSPMEDYMAFALPMSTFVASVILLVIAARAAAAITHEKERDTWDSLLCTPLTPTEIILGKTLGNLYALRWLILVPIVICLPAAFFSLDFLVAAPFILANQLVLCGFVTALGVVFSLRSSNTLRSMAGTLGVTLLLGGGYFVCCCMPLAIGGGGDDLFFELMWAPCMPFLLFAPTCLYMELHDGDLGAWNQKMLVAYTLGMIGYAIAAFFLYSSSVGTFDEMSGRTSTRFGLAKRGARG